jgi:tetratricopeptide (TPR) repeat protein
MSGAGMRKDETIARLKAALADHEAGRLSAAEAIYLDILSKEPAHPIALLYLGVVHHDRGDHAEAVRLIERAIRAGGPTASAYNHLGLALLGLQKVEQAAEAFRKALKVRPDHTDALNNLANAQRRLGQNDAAEQSFEAVLRIAPGHTSARYNLGLLHHARQNVEKAQAAFLAVLQRDPRHFKALHYLGVIAETHGDFGKSETLYLQALDIQPDYTPALSALLALKSYKPDAAMIARAEALAAAETLAPPEAFTLPFAIAKRLDAQGDYAKAFFYLEMANRRRGTDKTYERGRVEAMMARYRATYTAHFVRERARHGHGSDRPLFVVGMPRTGTTLTEQILGMHAQIQGAGELPHLPRLIANLPQRLGVSTPYPDCVAAMDTSHTHALAEDYLAVLAAANTKNAPFVVDKNPFNFLNIGLIAMTFPRARIVHCTRHPLDVGLSCFMELFELGQDFTTSLDNFAHYFAQYRALMRYWREEVGAPFIESSYEALVTNQEAATRRLLADLDLPWDDSCLNFQSRANAVLTPSRWQVRQSIYTSSRERWRNYEAQLRPLRDALEREGVALSD